VNEQLGQLENAISRKVDGIAICPTNETGVIPAVSKAKAAGIPVVSLSAIIPTEDVLTNVQPDEEKAAKMVAEYAIKQEGKEGGFNAIILSGLAGNITSDQRTKGYEDAIKEFPNGKLLDEQLVEFNREKGMSVTENLLSKYPKVDFIFCINDNAALGCYEAVAAAGRENEIVVVGDDGVPDGLKSILEGRMKYSVWKNPFKMGEDAIAAFVNYWDGKEVPKWTVTPSEVITKDNAQSFLDVYDQYIQKFEK